MGAHSSCGSLQGQCCPTTNGGYLDCCDKGGSTPAAAPVPAPAPVPFIAQNDGITNSNTPGTPGSLAGGGQTVTTTDGQGVQATFAVNPEGLCISNGIGGTCTNSAFPSIACCTDSVTGAFFNGCCVQGFSGMILGDQDNDGNPNEFDVIIAPTDQYGLADCVALDNQQGCSVLSTPNQAPASLPGNACTGSPKVCRTIVPRSGNNMVAPVKIVVAAVSLMCAVPIVAPVPTKPGILVT